MQRVLKGDILAGAMSSARSMCDDAFDYDNVKITNKIRVSFEYGGYLAGTLPELQQLRRKAGGQGRISIVINGKAILL